jgi:hypothetical protein
LCDAAARDFDFRKFGHAAQARGVLETANITAL